MIPNFNSSVYRRVTTFSNLDYVLVTEHHAAQRESKQTPDICFFCQSRSGCPSTLEGHRVEEAESALSILRVQRTIFRVTSLLCKRQNLQNYSFRTKSTQNGRYLGVFKKRQKTTVLKPAGVKAEGENMLRGAFDALGKTVRKRVQEVSERKAEEEKQKLWKLGCVSKKAFVSQLWEPLLWSLITVIIITVWVAHFKKAGMLRGAGGKAKRSRTPEKLTRQTDSFTTAERNPTSSEQQRREENRPKPKP